METSKFIRSLITLLVILAFTPLIQGGCGGGGGGGSGGAPPLQTEDQTQQCPQATELYAFAQDVHQEALEKLHFNSTWEMTVKSKYTTTPELRRSYVTPDTYEEDYSGVNEFSSETTYTFTMPDAPEALSCEAVSEYQTIYENDPSAAEALVTLDEYSNLDESLRQMIQGSGEHWTAEEGDWYTQKYVFQGLLCMFNNPCPRKKAENSGCSRTDGVHSVDAELFISWFPGEDPVISTTTLNETVTPSELPYQIVNYIDDDDNVDVGYDFDPLCVPPGPIQDPTVICDCTTTSCLGESSREKPCGISFSSRRVEVSEEIPLQNGTYTIIDDENNKTTVTLVCKSGCECIASTDCDDGRECTRDECNQGNCENIPDMTIVPQQISGDCRSCDPNGEVVSMRELWEDECQQLLSTTLNGCVDEENWLLHWVEDLNGAEFQYHYCESGVVGVQSELTICDGTGECATGAPVENFSGQVDRSCQNELGENLQFVCDVICSSCP